MFKVRYRAEPGEAWKESYRALTSLQEAWAVLYYIGANVGTKECDVEVRRIVSADLEGRRLCKGKFWDVMRWLLKGEY